MKNPRMGRYASCLASRLATFCGNHIIVTLIAGAAAFVGAVGTPAEAATCRGRPCINVGAFNIKLLGTGGPADTIAEYQEIGRLVDATMDLDTREEYFRQWRTWQISDHMPLWLELEIDFTDQYLERINAAG